MPTYEYVCQKCKHSFSLVLTMAEHQKGKVKCPKCQDTKPKQKFSSFFVKTSKKS